MSSESDTSVSISSDEICSLSNTEDENVFYNKEPEYTKEELKRMESKKKENTKYIYIFFAIYR